MKKIIIEQLRLLAEEDAEKKEDNIEDIEDEVIGDEAHSKIKGLLDNEIFNHAEIARRLWGAKNDKEEATIRSLFRKKLNRDTNEDSGYKYGFTKQEAKTINDILGDTQQKISRALPRRRKGDELDSDSPQ